MKNLRRILLTSAAALGIASVASANTISYVTTTPVNNQSTEVSYNLVLQKFDSSLGTLTGVTIYFYGTETSSTLDIKNNSGGTITADAVASVNLTSSTTNTAFNSDRFLGENVTVFDTGLATNSALGSCANSATPITGGANCTQVTVLGGATNHYGPITVANTDSPYGLTTGTGSLGTFGVVKTDTNSSNILNYVGTGTFSLTGTTVNATTQSGAGGNFQFTQIANASFTAEVDYTYTVPTGTPEPATFALFGGALLGAGLLRKRILR